jgi:DNA-binding IclR family transcriptional regulator
MTHLKRANTLQTLDRGLQILELLTRSELGPTDLARALDIERTAVHRILRTLMQRGFVERVSANGYYRANLRHLLALTGELATSREQNWLTLAKSHLEELRVATGLSANLCMPGSKEMVYLMQALAVKDLVVNSPPGTRRPLYSSAVGKAYLASLPEPELNALLATLELRPLTPRTITSATTLKEHLLKARARGYYIDDGECNLSIICVAAPIFDRFGRPIESIGV